MSYNGLFVPNSGPISFSDLRDFYPAASGAISLSKFYRNGNFTGTREYVQSLPASGPFSFSDFYNTGPVDLALSISVSGSSPSESNFTASATAQFFRTTASGSATAFGGGPSITRTWLNSDWDSTEQFDRVLTMQWRTDQTGGSTTPSGSADLGIWFDVNTKQSFSFSVSDSNGTPRSATISLSLRSDSSSPTVGVGSISISALANF